MMNSVGKNVETLLLGHTTSQNKARRHQHGPDPVSPRGDIGAVDLAVLQQSSFLGTRASTLSRRLADRGETGSLELWNTQYYNTISNWPVVIRPSYQSGGDRTLYIVVLHGH